MKSKLLNDRDGTRTFALVFERGEDVMAPLRELLRAESITAARLTGVGALESVTLGYFNWERKEYEQHRLNGQVELLSLVGDTALRNGEPEVHAHVVLGCRDTTTRGGHLIDATVRPTLELILEDAPAHLHKQLDRETGLALIAPEL
jgi:predicted DNA-binding protein with PD1-like motif